MKKSLQQRHEEALELRRQGYNCAQSVVMVFDDVTGLTPALAAKTAMGLGAGVGGMKEICGVPNGMAIVLGLVGEEHPSHKGACAAKVRELATAFREKEGALTCAELKRPGALKPCDQLILDGIEMLHDYLAKDNA